MQLTKPTNTFTILGLMSGSSLDGLDIAACRFETQNNPEGQMALGHWEIVAAETQPFTTEWQSRLRQLPQESAFALAQTHADFGHYMAGLVNDFLLRHAVIPDYIASHGHTIFHFPDRHFTTQIGDGAALAARTGIPVICDFRAGDIALGGQGAPLAPIADQWLFPGYDFYLNIGGIANITAYTGRQYIAFDIGGANQILNALARQLGKPYDAEGQIAASGALDNGLLERVNELPYFRLPYPKSLGNQWVQNEQLPLFLQSQVSLPDQLRTATEQIASQIAAAIKHIIVRESMSKPAYRLLATGGGALNDFLVQCIHPNIDYFCDLEIVLPSMQIIQFKEAALMALLGLLRIHHIPNCLPQVTGADGAAIGGAIYT